MEPLLSDNFVCVIDQWHRPFHPPSLILCVLSLDSFLLHKGAEESCPFHGYNKTLVKVSLCWAFGSNFWKFYLNRMGFTIDELIFLVKVFRLFKLERIVFGVQSVDTVRSRCTTSYLLAGPACL